MPRRHQLCQWQPQAYLGHKIKAQECLPVMVLPLRHQLRGVALVVAERDPGPGPEALFDGMGQVRLPRLALRHPLECRDNVGNG